MKIRGNQGFTLVETIIAILILSFITIYTAVTIRKSLEDKSRLQSQIDDSSEVVKGLTLLEKELSQAWSMKFPYLKALAGAETLRKQRLDTLIQSNPEFIPNNSFRPFQMPQLNYPFRMKGSEDEFHWSISTHKELHFELNKARPYNIAEVGYYLDSCKNSEHKCLWRRFSPVIDDKISEGGRALPLIRNVKSFKISYFPRDLKDEPESSWGQNTIEGPQPWPKMIRIQIIIEKEKRQESYTLLNRIPIK